MDKPAIYQQTLRHFLDPIWPLLEDESISEVLINGHDKIYFERSGKLSLSEKKFADNAGVDGCRPQYRRIRQSPRRYR